MKDSVENKPEAQPEKPSESTVISKTIRNRGGGFRTSLVDSQGKFVKKPKKMPDSREVTRFLRNLGLSKLEIGPDGRLTKSSKSLIQNMTENIARIAMYDGGDPKSRMAAVSAFKEVMERMWGKTPPSDQELGALERAGVKIVVITAPDIPNSGELQPREHFKPSFVEPPLIEGEIVEDSKSN